MKRIDQNELYQNLCGFLKSQGITLGEGAYAQGIKQSCGMLADAINATQETLAQARIQIDQQLEHLRQSIHEATAPPASSAAESTTASTEAGAKRSKRRMRTRPKGQAKSAKKTRSADKVSKFPAKR